MRNTVLNFLETGGYPKVGTMGARSILKEMESFSVYFHLVETGHFWGPKKVLYYPPPNLLPSEISALGLSLIASVAVEGQGPQAHVKTDQRKDPFCNVV